MHPSKQQPLPFHTIGESLEQKRRFTIVDFWRLKELVVTRTTCPDRDLVVKTLFSWTAAAHTLDQHPGREGEIIDALNATITIQDQKRKFVESGFIKDAAQQGLDFFRNIRSLPEGALATLWDVLEGAIRRNPGYPSPDQ